MRIGLRDHPVITRHRLGECHTSKNEGKYADKGRIGVEGDAASNSYRLGR